VLEDAPPAAGAVPAGGTVPAAGVPAGGVLVAGVAGVAPGWPGGGVAWAKARHGVTNSAVAIVAERYEVTMGPLLFLGPP
jgi:hypothetical protein